MPRQGVNINEPRLLELFRRDVSGRTLQDTSKEDEEQIHLIDANKAKGLGKIPIALSETEISISVIVLTRFKMEISKIRQMIWTLDVINLTPDRLQVLLKHLPTETEVTPKQILNQFLTFTLGAANSPIRWRPKQTRKGRKVLL